MKKHLTLRNISYQVLLILLAVWPALYNRFPLVTPDTGAYVHNGIRWSLGIDRPIGYGLFIFFTSWKISLWGPILVQGAIFSWLIQTFCKHIFSNKVSLEIISIITIIITFGTAAAWYNGQLMADAFSGMLVLAILLLFSGNISNKLRVCYCS